MTVDELIEEYRLTSARFRDAFPTSFGKLMPQSKKVRSKTPE
jgi:hypothetical protein